jgi:hypothetical protein
MKSWKKSAGLVLLAAIVIGLTARAQLNQSTIAAPPPDSIVQLAAEDQGLEWVAPETLPRNGTFWVVTSNGLTAPYPCFPGTTVLPVYAIVDGIYLVDQTAGQVNPNVRRFLYQPADAPAVSPLEALASTVLNLIGEIQAATELRELRQMYSALGMDAPPGFDETGEGGTNYFDGGFSAQVFTTNDLWLEITGTTNSGSAMTGYLVIHPPWNVTNGVYDLFATTNLAPSAWQFVVRCDPGQTNLTVTDRAIPMEFYILGLTTDTDTDGLTDAFETLVTHTNPNSTDTDNDGVSDYVEYLQGRNPRVAGVTPDTNGVVQLITYTPLY